MGSLQFKMYQLNPKYWTIQTPNKYRSLIKTPIYFGFPNNPASETNSQLLTCNFHKLYLTSDLQGLPQRPPKTKIGRNSTLLVLGPFVDFFVPFMSPALLNFVNYTIGTMKPIGLDDRKMYVFFYRAGTTASCEIRNFV